MSKKISELTAAGALTGAEIMVGNQAGTTKKFDDLDDISARTKDYIEGDGALTVTLTLSGKLTGGAFEIEGSNFDINGGAIDAVTLGTNSAVTEAQIDNINLNGNEIKATSGDLTLNPSGANEVIIGSDTEANTRLFRVVSKADAIFWLEADKDNTGNNENPSFVMSQQAGAVISEWGLNGSAGQNYTNSTADALFFHMQSEKNMEFAVDGERWAVITPTGAIFMPAVYSDDVSGKTFRDLQIADDGQLGYNASIREAKMNIVDIDPAFIYNLRPVEFNYRERDPEGLYLDVARDELEYGLIAEEVEEINSELVFYDNSKMSGVYYRKLTAVLLKAVQDLNERLNLLEQV